MAVIEEGIEAIMLPIEIYETTDDSSGLVVDRLHYFFDQIDPETLRMAELYVISNPGDMTVDPDEETQTTLDFELPAEATNLEILDGEIGERFVKDGKRVCRHISRSDRGKGRTRSFLLTTCLSTGDWSFPARLTC